MHRFMILGVGALGVSTLAPAAFAQFRSNFVTPEFRGSASSEFSQWETFSEAHTPGLTGNAPDVVTSGGGELFQLTAPQENPNPFGEPPLTLLQGVNNIYTGWQVGDFILRDDASADIQTVSLQVATSGNRFDWGAFELVFTGIGGEQRLSPSAVNELFSEELMIPTPGGIVTSYNQEYQLLWDLTGLGDDILAYEIDFETTESSISLDAMELDVALVPTPGSGTLLVAGGLLLSRRRR